MVYHLIHVKVYIQSLIRVRTLSELDAINVNKTV